MRQMSHHTVAVAQIGLSVLFITGYFAMLGLFVTGHINTPAEWKDTVQALMGVLTGGVVTIIAYWFSRQRQSEDAPPPEEAQ